MILFLAGDLWTWNVALRYEDASGTRLEDRERWTVRVATGMAFTAERAFVGTVVDDGTVIPAAPEPPEILKGKIERDGTLTPDGDWSDPAANRAIRRLLKPDLRKDDLLAGWPLVRRATLHESEVRLPGSDLKAALRVEATLAAAKLGGRDVLLRKTL